MASDLNSRLEQLHMHLVLLAAFDMFGADVEDGLALAPVTRFRAIIPPSYLYYA